MTELLSQKNLLENAKQYDLQRLNEELRKAEAALQDARMLVSRLGELVHARVSESFSRERQRLGKDSGTVNAVIDGLKVKSTIPKTVSWDSDLLNSAADMLEHNGFNPTKIMDYKLSVRETVFNNLHPDIKKALTPARTVKLGKEKIEIIKGEG